jgi:hypothetical protein
MTYKARFSAIRPVRLFVSGLNAERGMGDLQVAREEEMEWQGGRSGNGWCLIGKKESDGSMEPWAIHDVVYGISKYVQPTELNMDVIIDKNLRSGNLVQMGEHRAAKRANAAERKKAAELRKIKIHKKNTPHSVTKKRAWGPWPFGCIP